ncbi:MAG: YkgJ family cysteine cluster protein [Euryarchaeota archaeon]|nr:YkgJ family cysteine cluster protein [Euryarchaeota archaeon]
MTEFVCTICGRCCMGMGRYVKVISSMGNGQIIGRHELGKETFYGRIEKPYRNSFDPDNDERDAPEGWCPFLKKISDEKYVCIIYNTRPQFCRNFKCCRMRIFDNKGSETGMIKGKATLSTDDSSLNELWAEKIAPIPFTDDKGWMSEVIHILEEKGYSVEVYD